MTDGNTKLHRVIGIDLGTTYSAVAAYDTYKEQAVIIPNRKDGGSGQTTPSVVSVNKNSGWILVGRPAKDNIPNNPNNTVIEVKREMGDVFSDETLKKYEEILRSQPLQQNISHPNVKDPVKVLLNGQTFTPQEISALILMKMKSVAEEEMQCEIYDAVITVPAYFMEPQKKATEEAARLAGLHPCQIIPEPTAAAICYGVDQYDDTRKTYLVYDLGGGTFDVSIITVEQQKIAVIATSGDPRLGGGDFDDKITEWAIAKLKQDYNLDVSNNLSAKALIKNQAEQAKIQLSTFEKTALVLGKIGSSGPFTLELTRAEFEQMIDQLLNKSLTYVDIAVNMAEEKKGLKRENITAILLVGGSSKIPRVRAKLLEYFQKDESFLRADLDPDAVVARGAAIIAHRFFEPKDKFDIDAKTDSTLVTTDAAQDLQIWLITEHSLGVGVQDNRVVRIVEQGADIPVFVTKGDFTNPGPVDRVHVQVYQGEGEYTFQNTLIGELEIGPMEIKPANSHLFEVTFKLDRDGLLSMVINHLNENKTYPAVFDQRTGIKKESLARIRRKLLDLWETGFGPTVGRPTPAQPTQPAISPQPIMPPQPTMPSQPQASVQPAGAMLEITASVPEELKQTVRRVQKQLAKDMNLQLLEAYNTFVRKLNAGASQEDLLELGDVLADVFDDVRR